MCLGTNASGHKCVWAQSCLDTIVSEHKCVWVQTCLGTYVSGQCVWAQTCLGTNVCGHKRVWAQTCVCTNVCGHNRVSAQTCLGTNVCGHSRVGPVVLGQSCMGTNVVELSGIAASRVLNMHSQVSMPVSLQLVLIIKNYIQPIWGYIVNKIINTCQLTICWIIIYDKRSVFTV